MDNIKHLTIIATLLFNGLFVESQQKRYQTCREDPITNIFGELDYIPPNDRLEDQQCQWTFDFNKTNQDFVLVLDFFYFYQGSHQNSSIRLPHEDNLSQSPRLQPNPTCQLYYDARSPMSDCLSNLTKLYCSSTPMPTARWPPQIRTYNHRSPATSMYFTLAYIILTCPFNEDTLTDSVTQPDELYDESNCQETKEVDMAVVITLAVLLLLTFIALLVSVYKLRQRKSGEEPFSKQHNSSSSNSSLKNKGSTKFSLENVEKQIVDNIIYESCDKRISSSTYESV